MEGNIAIWASYEGHSLDKYGKKKKSNKDTLDGENDILFFNTVPLQLHALRSAVLWSFYPLEKEGCFNALSVVIHYADHL